MYVFSITQRDMKGLVPYLAWAHGKRLGPHMPLISCHTNCISFLSNIKLFIDNNDRRTPVTLS
jgi:hypothetical protein